MAFWEIDLTTRAGALGAAQTAATACFVYAAASSVGAVMSGALLGGTEVLRSGAVAASVLVVAAVEIGVSGIAGLRLRKGKGAYWGIAAAIVVVLDIIAHLVSMMGFVGLALCVVVLVLLVQGIRGALALKQGTNFEDDDIEVFT